MCRIVEDLIDIEKREIALEILKLKRDRKMFQTPFGRRGENCKR